MLNTDAIGMLSPCGGILLGMATTIAERIRAAREAKGWTKAELARRLRVRPPSVTQLESGDSTAPSSETLTKMREAGINPDYIMRGKGPKLLDNIERKLRDDTLHSMIGELDEGEKEMVEDLVKGIIRRKGGSTPNDPFKIDPPKDPE